MRRCHLLVLPACFVSLACNRQFEPDGGYDGRLAVYAIFSTSTDTQYVRIGRTYTTADPGDITDAVVDVIPGNGAPTVHFRDTTVVHRDPSGQGRPYNVYVAYNFRPQPYVTYQLTATSPGAGSARGSTVALGPVEGGIVNPSSVGTSPDSIVLYADFGTSVGAYVMELFVGYEQTLNGVTTAGRVEVPVGSTVDGSGNPSFEYPGFGRVPPVQTGNGYAAAYLTFPKGLYLSTRSRLVQNNPPGTIRITSAIYTLTQIDEALYDYYYILNGPKDTGTIRLDAPDFTNITNGLGVIASTQIIVQVFPLSP
jgi:hypothetical protein